MKKIFLIVAIFLSLQIVAQKKIIGIKFSPLALFDPINFKAIQLGVENRIYKQYSLYNELGLKYMPANFENIDSFSTKIKGFRYKIEVRYYFSGKKHKLENLNALKGFYMGANVFYSLNTFNYKLKYFTDSNSTLSGVDVFKVKKIVVSPNIIIGREMRMMKYLYLDAYLGVGLRIRTIDSKMKEFDEKKHTLFMPKDITINGSRDFVYAEDKQTLLPNLTMGIRFGFKF